MNPVLSGSLQVPLPGAQSDRSHKLKTSWRSGTQTSDISGVWTLSVVSETGGLLNVSLVVLY